MSSVRYLDKVSECYKVIPHKMVGETQHYRVQSVRKKPIESPNNAVVQSIAKRFLTQSCSEAIYSSSYGVNWERFVGRALTKQLAIDIETEVREALLVSPFVTSVSVDVGALDASTVVVNARVEIEPTGVFTIGTTLGE